MTKSISQLPVSAPFPTLESFTIKPPVIILLRELKPHSKSRESRNQRQGRFNQIRTIYKQPKNKNL